MPFPYHKTLVLGATSGIGEALAARITQEGGSVIAVGRRQERLDAFVSSHGSDKATAVTFDVNALSEIPAFAAKITKAHPDLDCVILNSGIQRGTDFAHPDSVDLEQVETEFTTNYLSYIHLTKAFLPFLQAKKSRSALVYMSSGLALVPILRCPNYCATKAALHQFLLVFRQQVKDSAVAVVEIFPPMVDTELHDAKHQPDYKGPAGGMPLDKFTDDAYAGLVRGDTEIPVGDAKKWYDSFESHRQETFFTNVKAMTASAGK
ncbi:MAG: hypothetical protein M1838_006164 [Thelocarpon superellum]|nr:MAG: hypothetical protein M1838_006164 [Thelocarpon superellum]